MLCLDRESESLVFGNVVQRPQPVEYVEPEIAAQRFLDHLAIAAPEASSADLDSTEDRVIEATVRPARACILYTCHAQT